MECVYKEKYNYSYMARTETHFNTPKNVFKLPYPAAAAAAFTSIYTTICKSYCVKEVYKYFSPSQHTSPLSVRSMQIRHQKWKIIIIFLIPANQPEGRGMSPGGSDRVTNNINCVSNS